jgi:hypothetical protein
MEVSIFSAKSTIKIKTTSQPGGTSPFQRIFMASHKQTKPHKKGCSVIVIVSILKGGDSCPL